MTLTDYQRGNRDGLLSFADELQSMVGCFSDEYAALVRRRAAAMQVVARLRRGGMSREDAQRLLQAMPHSPPRLDVIAALARERAKALPEPPPDA